MPDAWVLSAARTAVGSFGGTLRSMPAVDLGSAVIRESLRRSGVPGTCIDEVLMGCVLQAGQGQGPARQSALKAGLPREVPATTVNMMCGSGLQTIIMGAKSVMSGDARAVVAGGMESMSRAPYILDGAREGYRMGHGNLLDSMILDGLWCSLTGVHMGLTAEGLAKRYGIGRKEQDEFALASQGKAERAIQSGLFEREIVPLKVPGKKGLEEVFAKDEHPRFGSTMEALSGLRPAFQQDGTVTAGNSSGINDGAAACILVSGGFSLEQGMEPLGLIRAYACCGVDPALMGLGPIEASKRALDRAGLSMGDIDLVELNEAFAAQALAVLRELNLDPSRVNVNGGAIALGHPIGASGTRILVSLLHEMKRRGVRLGLATLCIGGGMGISVVVENALT